jgi:hypothetical protein
MKKTCLRVKQALFGNRAFFTEIEGRFSMLLKGVLEGVAKGYAQATAFCFFTVWEVNFGEEAY